MPLVILTGASGSGKTAIAEAIEQGHPSISVFRFDSIGVPSPEVIGEGHQPGGAWQRSMTFRWMEKIAPILATGTPVLFEGQMRIAFIREALAASGIEDARILCVDCDNATRTKRLAEARLQPELASDSMMGWASFLRREALEAGCGILDTTNLSLVESVAGVLSMFSGVPDR